MKRLLALIMALAMLLSSGVLAAVSFPLSVYVDGQRVQFPDATPFIDGNNRTMVPVRFVSEALNAEVGWDGALRQVTVTKDSKKIVLTINKPEMQINGVTKVLDCAPLIVDDRTFVPIRFVSEALDAVVEWDGAVRTVYISTKKKEEEKKEEEEKKQENDGRPDKVGGAEGQPFQTSVNEEDIYNSINGSSYVTRPSGLGLNFQIKDSQVLSLHYYQADVGDIVKANEEAISVLSQGLKDETVQTVKKLLDDGVVNKDCSEYVVIDEDTFSVVVMSTYKNFTIYVYNNNL